MLRDRGDLWDWWEAGHRIVISTNIGYCPRTSRNNMGAGIALQAACRFPELSEWYGRQCAKYRERTPVLEREDLDLLFFPVKPFRHEDPERGWAQGASLDLIRRGARELAALAGGGMPVALSTVGAGPAGSGGGLDPLIVEELLDAELRALGDHVTLVHYEPRARTA